MQTIQQERAKFALKRVLQAKKDLENLKQEDRKETRANKDTEIQAREADKKTRAAKAKDEYKSYASALPAMIHMNGLGQAAAFYKAKGGTHKLIYDLLSDWLTDKKYNQPYAGKDDLINGITGEDMHKYRLAQAEAQALMDWVKKFAKAYMTED